MISCAITPTRVATMSPSLSDKSPQSFPRCSATPLHAETMSVSLGINACWSAGSTSASNKLVQRWKPWERSTGERAAMLAKTRQAVSMTTGARKVWESVYPKLSEGRDGLLGSATARAEAQCLRLALLYALLDEQPEIDVAHVLAGIAVWEYCDATARFVFGDAIGDRVADDIRRDLLRSWDTGMSRTDIRNLFNRHESGERIEQALDLLDKRGQVRRERRNTGGRPEDIWYAGGATEATYATKAGRA